MIERQKRKRAAASWITSATRKRDAFRFAHVASRRPSRGDGGGGAFAAETTIRRSAGQGYRWRGRLRGLGRGR